MERLNKRKQIIKGQLTRTSNYIDSQGNDASYDELQARLLKVQELYKQFIEVEDLIFEIDPTVQSEMDGIDDAYFTMVPKLQGLCREKSLNPLNGPPKSADDSVNNSQSMGISFKPDFKLPRLSLPIFDGSLKDWHSFYDIFISTVHENTGISPAQKFKYLLGQLRGPPYKLICHFRIDDANYYEAFQRLTKRYEKQKPIVNEYIKTFLRQSNVNKPNAPSILRIHDIVDETVRGLKSIGPKAEHRDPWIIYLAFDKLDEETKQLWKYESSEDDFPSIDEFLKFLLKRSDALTDGDQVKPKPKPITLPSTSRTFHAATLPSCPLCVGEQHNLYQCTKFINKSVKDRREFMAKSKRCYNCLSEFHVVSICKSKRSCRKCNKRHNTLLHLDTDPKKSSQPGVDTVSITTPNTQTENFFVNNALEVRNSILESVQQTNRNIHILPTASIQVMDSKGNWIVVRALLDSGSTHSFITETCAKRLKVPRLKTQVSVGTLNNCEAGVSRGVTNFKIRSIWDQEYHLQISALIIPTISTKLPSTNIETSYRQISSLSLQLADQEYYKPAPIDILLGCDHFFDSLIDGKITLIPNVLIIKNTRFGWIVGGNYNQVSINSDVDRLTVLHIQPNMETCNLEQTLRKFWETEELPSQRHLSDEERKCIESVKSKVSFVNERIVVQLPFKQIPPLIGESYFHALKRFHALERRLSVNCELKHEYIQFLREYESLGQMELIPKNEIDKPYNELFYLPHHPVVKESSSTTRLRVVFDGSAKSRNGQSLNDNLPIGPTIQENLSNILLRFRKHKYVISADIEKMFRQILVGKPDTDYQRILWRESPDAEIKQYRLCTVTYGTTTAPFLATYALQLLSEKYEEVHPIASSVLRSDFYMDDLISGANTLEEALHLQKDLIALLKKGKFRLRKWSGNHPALLNTIAIEERELSSWNITDGTKMISVLGIKYHPIKDLFYFKIELPEVTNFTKRIFLSETSRIYDPLGFLSPVTVGLKILYQKLWIAGIDWDDKLTPELQQSWMQIRNELDKLSEIKIPRWLYTSQTAVELHCFADASKDAYAAVIYSRTVNDDIVNTNLIAAKTRVAPIKIVSVPKLELCGATLLTRLLRLIIDSLKFKEDPKIYLYTDSTITLNWLSKPPKVWETYIANRTSEILTYTNRSQWYYVRSSQNPADLATRGLFPQDLINNNLWFSGPEFISKHPYQKPQQFKATIEPSRDILVHHSTLKNPYSELLLTLINRISNFRTMTNVLGYALRFIKHSRNRPSGKKVGIVLSVSEFQEAQYFIFRMVQAESYGIEIKQLKNNLPLPKKSNLFSFHPFLNGNELLRVGGRLSHADINYDAKHPILLPMKHPITKMIVREMHHNHLHAGLQLMMSTIRQQFQIPRVKNLIREISHRCFVCRRHKGQQQQQLMGQLPECRVTAQVKPFVQVGTDLAGPFILKSHRNRGAKPYKAYLVVFICMATKAVSLEIVSDLSTTTFIAALKRFCAVRGYCHEIFCDNGTNFVGASKEVRDLYQIFTSEVDLNNVQAWCTDKLIKFHFIPPAAPSFGGLWEAAVKSCKFHIRRVLGETQLTYEEFLTLIKQIEALLNSRPIGDLSADCYDPLTPGHFLITQPFTTLPEPDLTLIKMNTLTRWQLIQQMYQSFWNRWSKEYLTSLNKFVKWHNLNPNFKTGDLVIISNQSLPPSKWPLARIAAEHPGDDGVVRVVTLRLPSGTIMKRPVNKLCLLPQLNQIN